MKINRVAMLLIAAFTLSIAACDKPTSSSSSVDSSVFYYDINFTDTEIPADDYTYHQWTIMPPYEFLSQGGYKLIAEYKATLPIDRVSESSPDSDGYYHCYLSFPYAEGEKPTLPDRGLLNWNASEECDILLVNIIGDYATYTKYFYSETARAIKCEQAVFKPLNVVNAEQMKGKTILDLFLTNQGELWILSANNQPSKNIEKIETFEKTTYLKVADDINVTFEHNTY